MTSTCNCNAEYQTEIDRLHAQISAFEDRHEALQSDYEAVIKQRDLVREALLRSAVIIGEYQDTSEIQAKEIANLTNALRLIANGDTRNAPLFASGVLRKIEGYETGQHI